MSTAIIIEYSFTVIIVIVYLFVTIRYSIGLRKSILFPKRTKIVHIILIWAIPFIWIVILKSLTEPTPGSHQFDNKKDKAPFFDAYNNYE